MGNGGTRIAFFVSTARCRMEWISFERSYWFQAPARGLWAGSDLLIFSIEAPSGGQRPVVKGPKQKPPPGGGRRTASPFLRLVAPAGGQSLDDSPVTGLKPPSRGTNTFLFIPIPLEFFR